MALSLIYFQPKFKILHMGKYNYQYSLFIAIYTVMAELQLLLGRIHSDLEEFVEAQTQLQCSFEAHKMIYGVEHKNTMQARLGAAMTARLAGNPRGAEEILESEEKSLLGE